MKTTAIYLRVSSANGQKFNSQLEDINHWLENKQPAKVNWYKDKFTGNSNR